MRYGQENCVFSLADFEGGILACGIGAVVECGEGFVVAHADVQTDVARVGDDHGAHR